MNLSISKGRKFILSVLISILMILFLRQSIIYAQTQSDTALYVGEQHKKIIPQYKDGSPTDPEYKEESGFGFSYKLGNEQQIYQLIKYKNGEFKDIDGTNLYCLNAPLAIKDKDNSEHQNTHTFTHYFDLTNKETMLADEDNVMTAWKNSQYKLSEENYKELVWLLNNIYVPTKDANKEAYLAKAGIVKGTLEVDDNKKEECYYYDSTVNPDSVFSKKEFYEGNHLKQSVWYSLYGREDGYNPNVAEGDYIGYEYQDKEGKKCDVILPDEMIEVVQQSAIWYFTNYKKGEATTDKYNQYTDQYDEQQGGEIVSGTIHYNLQYSSNTQEGEEQYKNISEYKVTGKHVGGNKDEYQVPVGEMYQEQAAILYNYLIDEAKKAAKNNTEDEETASISLQKADNYTVIKNESGYKVGPFKVTAKGNISDIKISVSDESKEEESKNITEQCTTNPETITPEHEFYITLPEGVGENIKITASAKATKMKETLWLDDTVENQADGTQQPVVVVEPEVKDVNSTLDINITNEKFFDLALRKEITLVRNTKNGLVVPMKNENGYDATRNITADTTSIPDTATYKHRKDPVVVDKDYEVTYKIHIYNEGDIDGYASKIVDQLPTGLAFKGEGKWSDKDKKYQLQSSKGNTYNIFEYDYYDDDGNPSKDNKLTLEIDENQTITPIKAYNNNGTLDSDTITLTCKVKQESTTQKHYLANIAYIAEAKDSLKQVRTQDRNNTESQPEQYPSYTAEQLNTNEVFYKGNEANKSIYEDTNNEEYYKGQEDDDDFETVVVLPKEFDLKLVKRITEVNGDSSLGRANITVNTSNLNKTINGKKVTTADYDVSKDPILVETGDIVTYTFRIYNEGDIDGYASEISENIPEGLEFIYSTLEDDTAIDADTTLSAEEKEAIKYNRERLWTFDKNDKTNKTIKTTYLSRDTSIDNLINAFDPSKDDGKGKGLDYEEVSVKLRVTSKDVTKIIRNEAAITEDTNSEGDPIDDRDSEPENWPGKDDHDKYQDDEDYDNIKLKRFDLALRKFITAISKDVNINDGEYLTTDGTTKTAYTRAPQVDSTKLKSGEETTAIYNHPKNALTVNVGDYVVYTIRVYNEGDIDGFAGQIKDYLPQYLNFIEGQFNTNYGWTCDKDNNKIITTNYLSYEEGEKRKEEGKENPNLLKQFNRDSDNGKGSGLSYIDIPVLCRVADNAVTDQNITNIAEITQYQGSDGTQRDEDIDSEPGNLNYPTDVPGYEGDRNGKNTSDTYYPGQQDDDDFDRVIIKKQNFDLALRKFITQVGDEEVTTRIPKVSYKDGKITYTHPKDVLKVVVGDTITYTIRVYNEGDIDGFAQTITDDIPEYLEYLPNNATNIKYRWKMYDKDGKETDNVRNAVKIVTDYTSKENGETLMEQDSKLTENPNLLSAFKPSEKISDTNPDYADVKVAFKVLDPNSSKHVIVNKAQISEDADKNGDPIDDKDSEPDKWNDGEDDQDYENVSVEYFDLALLKYVSEVQVTENGTTTTTKTGNNGSDKDIIPKVEIHRKHIKSTIVKFIYTIKVTNQGDIPGYATEITDYVPDGLEFHKEDNKGWTEKKKGVITTNLLSDTLLQPGESATVKVTFRWKNNENNMGVKTNVAEISKDKNDKGIPDRDSDPGNNKKGEDDIDDADVLLSIKTGLTDNIIAYVSGAAVILLVLAGGVTLIRKFVL